MQLTADITGAKLHVAQMADCSPLGATMMGQLGLGVLRTQADLVSTLRGERVYEPCLTTHDANRLHAGWRAAIGSVLTFAH